MSFNKIRIGRQRTEPTLECRCDFALAFAKISLCRPWPCGVHTAGLMILGLIAGRERLEFGLDGMMPIILPAQRMVKTLTARIGGHACLEMTGVDFTDLEAAMTYKLSGDHEKCVDRVGDGAQAIAELLQDLDAEGALFRI